MDSENELLPSVNGLCNVPPNELRANGKVSDKLVALLLRQNEQAKKDLEKNWALQITSLGVSLGLIYGFGDILSKKFFEETGHERIMYFVLVFVNFYFFMRFGLLATYFSKTRAALEESVKRYCLQEGFDGKISRVLTGTNSFFEFYSNRNAPIVVIAYYIFVPVVIGLNQVISIYLIHLLIVNRLSYSVLVIVYLICLLPLYWNYFLSNKDMYFMIFGSKIRYVMILLLIPAILLLVAIFRFVILGIFDVGSG
jgi:hypothetical protein